MKKKIYFKVAQIEYPKTYYIENNLQGLIESMKEDAEATTEPQGYCITPIGMTEEEFQNLPDFQGF